MKILLLTILTLNTLLFSNEVYRTKKIDSKITIDGKLDEQSWNIVDEIKLSYEIDPHVNVAASQNTSVKIVYDNENIYISFICFDTDISKLRAKISKRDQMFMDDFVILYLDTYNDAQKAYELMVNPFGIQGDALKTSNNEDINFDFIWKSAATINDSSWIVEVAIPFSNIRFPSNATQKWKILLGRNYPRESRFIFSPTKFDLNNNCMLCQGIDLVGIENISPSDQYEILPYVQSSQLNSFSTDTEKLASEKIKGRIGGGFKFSNSDFVLGTVINPDFSQIETDAAQISVNSTFALFYPEKRPFFIEGMDLFTSRNMVFNSRSINNPLAAIKLSGKNNNLSYGYLFSDDRNTPFTIPGEEESKTNSSDVKSISQIAKLRYDFGEEQNVALLFTTRSIQKSYNNVAGLDWFFRFNKNYFFGGTYNYSSTQELNDSNLFIKLYDPNTLSAKYSASSKTENFDGEFLSGHLFGSRIGFENKDYEFSLRLREISPLFQSLNGFINQVNKREVHLNQAFKFYPTSGIVDNFSIELNEGVFFNFENKRKELFTFIRLEAKLKGQINLMVGAIPVNIENWRNKELKMKPRLMMNVFAAPSSVFSYMISSNYGDAIYRDENPEIGTELSIGGSVSFKPNSNFSVSINQNYEELKRKNGNGLYYSGYITRVYNTYNFSEKIFLRLIAQYDGFGKSFSFFPLFTYQANPFTVFYMGTTSDFSQIGNLNNYRENTRQYFLKFQYLIKN